ncbi:MAG TPA: 4-hydroxy-3-methylbut-2-enyl diphosphate reductase [Candidatus Brocadiia bacterium]|nr:4-hydroxy-3-methylbut-2-enyl diphosphate reductase [Candidatus Brocadiia bacterium]
MRIRLARTAGFCMGVRRAMEIVLAAAPAEDREVLTDGPLIHNPQVLELLERRKIRAAKNLEEAEGKGIVIRAHGVPPDRRSLMKETCSDVIDATCPHVMRVQSIVKRHATKGYDIIIVGDEGHAEIVGLCGFAAGRGQVVGSIADLEKLPKLGDNVCVVAQTTQNRRVFNDIAAWIRNAYPNCEVHDTICDSTDERQSEVIELCEKVDAMVIVGGKKSANTCRLAEIARSAGKATYHVETEDELPVAELVRFRDIGVTAGASTPNWMIRRIVDRLADEAGKSPRNFACFAARLLNIPVRTCFFIGVGAAGLTRATSVVMELPPRNDVCAVAGLFVFAMHLLNHLTNREADMLNSPSRALFYERNRRLLVPLGIVAVVVGLFISAAIDMRILLLYAVGSALGVTYRLPRRPGRRARILRPLRLVPGNKAVLIAAAHLMVTTVFPYIAGSAANHGAFLCAGFFAFVLVLTRTVLFDLRSVQGDQFAGAETIPILLGISRSKQIVSGLCAAYCVFACVAYAAGWTGVPALLLLACVVYGLACFLIAGRAWWVTHEVYMEAVVDANFYLAGAISLLAG